MTDVLASVGNPTAVNIMPDPAVVNAGLCPELSGTLNVLSSKGLTMMFHGFLAVKGVQSESPDASVHQWTLAPMPHMFHKVTLTISRFGSSQRSQSARIDIGCS